MNWHNPYVGGKDHFELADAMKYIDKHRQTLRCLYLDTRNRDDSPIRYPNHPTISSLKHYVKLEHLLLTSQAIFNTVEGSASDFDLFTCLLPSNIVSLQVVGSEGIVFNGDELHKLLPRLAQGLEGLAEAVSRGQFCRLRRICWARLTSIPDSGLVEVR